MIYKYTLFILPLSLLAMCNGAPNGSLEFSSANDMANFAEAKMEAPSSPASNDILVERKLIKNGDLSFETNDVKKTKASLEPLCKEFNAYISNENQNHYGNRLQYSLTIRVPAEKFDQLLAKIESEAVKVENRNIHTQDVTEEFIDVEARLKTKKDLEERYKEILKQAKTVQDIVTIEGQLANVRAEIESMQGRLKFLNNQVSFSTLNVSFFQYTGTDFGFANKFVRGLRQGWDNLLAFFIVLANLWPFIILISAAWIGIRQWRKRNKKSVVG
jgi:hypothetical protein